LQKKIQIQKCRAHHFVTLNHDFMHILEKIYPSELYV